MHQPNPDTIEFLFQSDLIEDLLPKIGREPWQSLYVSTNGPLYRFGMWCALLEEEVVASALSHDSWDLTIGDSRPGFSLSRTDDKEVITYHRTGGHDGVWPLVFYRTFNGAFPGYLEVSEEFRLYHGLAEDKERGLLLSFDDSGREIDVVRGMPTEVQARLKYLRQFQAATRLHLAIYLDSVRYSTLPLAQVPSGERERVETEGSSRWRRDIAEAGLSQHGKTFSRLLCKVIIAPPSQERAGIWPFGDTGNQKAVAFIFGVDDDGNDLEHTSDPDSLSNYFGANPTAPHYLTPVFFRREVLAKYFAEPERYNVSDGRLACLDLWSCQIDNDLDSYVVVFLGDLGRDLPYEERLHWRQFNVQPEGGVSETNFRRSFLAQFAPAQSPDLVFRAVYSQVVSDWDKMFGWPLFLTPSPADAHLLSTVRIPVTNSQAELDEQVGHLAKLLVDSLNEKDLAARAGILDTGTKGIGKLASFLEETRFPERDEFVQLLRDLQTLRSTGSAHRKGSAYGKIVVKLGLGKTKKSDAIRRFLEAVTRALQALHLYYCGSQSDPSD